MRLSYLFLKAVAIISVTLLMSCSNGDEPEPFDCNTADLAIQLVASNSPTTCGTNNGSIQVSATGGGGDYTYTLNASTTFQSSATFSSLGPGSYSVTVKDKNGCTKTLSPIELTTPDAPVAGVGSSTPDTSCTQDNGALSINASGGAGALQYSLSGGSFQVSNVFSNLRAGAYTVTVKDESNCSVEVAAVVENGTGIDYVNDILPILQAKCQFSGCHPTNGNWFDYNTARNSASVIKQRTQNGSMPLGGASAPGGALSSDQLAVIACWVDHGAPQN